VEVDQEKGLIMDEQKETKLETKGDIFDRNYKKLFNICFYTVIGFVVFAILLSFFIYGTPAGVIGTIMDIFLNIWIWPFLILIFIFRKTHKAWSLILSIIFGVFTIIGAVGSILNPAWLQALQ
jgi:hypothetical protein